VKLSAESERLMRLLAGERVYKPPFWEPWFGMPDFFARRYGESNARNRIRMARDLGMAIVLLGGVDINLGFGRREETAEGVSRYSGGGLADLDQMDARELPDWTDTISGLREDQDLIKEAGLVSWAVLPWCFHSVATSMGLTNFSLRVHRDFDMVDQAFERVEERSRKAIDEVISEVRPDVILFDGDCSYKHGLMVRPDLFRRLVLERTRETLSHLKPLKIPYVFHTDGKLDDVIPVLVELGFSMVHGCESNANDLGDLVTRFGDQIVLAGNMDIGFLARAPVDRVREETRKMIETGSRKGKYVAACNTSPLDSIPDENYVAMAEEIGSYPG
jgi:uroporphyrinogen decarboxylase